MVDSADRASLLTLVCERSLAVGELEGVDGGRPYCTPDGVGAVLAVFYRDGLTGPVTRVVSVNQTGTPFLSTYRRRAGGERAAGRGLRRRRRGASPRSAAMRRTNPLSRRTR